MGHLGLEGMTDADIRKMNEEFRASTERYRAALKKALHWVATKDKPDKTAAWRMAKLFFGVTYEEAFQRGYHFGESDGRYQEQNRLEECCMGNTYPTCFFGREKQESKAPNEEYA